ncbi:aconitate hydratase AcnA [Herbinix luporum]|jgi:aconitate hydratase|uniref:aconitate hydratase AcnA n=1 Tax=Herbinix luporum TaxID=1679721 RepID=UPI00175A731D|nr:aconitate hydratase AcnA [Herbinix luporum]HHT58041.1 aconitate hydratase AcnA [Herbinix luporum]
MKAKFKESAVKQLKIQDVTYEYYNLESLEKYGYDIKHLPFSIKVLLESVLRQWDGIAINDDHIKDLAQWTKHRGGRGEVPFKPARVILQDFTGVPSVLDLASMREAIASMIEEGKTSKDIEEMIKRINPEVPVDLIIDHSVQVDYYGMEEALSENVKREFERNKERYQFLNWAQKAFNNFTVVPPSTGIVHQVNLEYLAKVVIDKEVKGKKILYPDTLVGTDSHTTMINGLGVLGWGVGGIEAEAGMLGQASYFPIPEVIGVRMVGKLPMGATATDLALRITKLLRDRGVVGKFVEYFGEGLKTLSLADRATIANMAPEYGATCGFFPVDEETLDYLLLTGRSKEHVNIVKNYLKANMMFYENDMEEPVYTEIIELDLSTVETALSGPKRPQDLIPLGKMKEEFIKSVTAPLGNHGHGLTKKEFEKKVEVSLSDGRKATMETGAVVIASITSCTNTSNPSVMLGAGLLAKKAVEKGLKVPAYVKTSLAPGSKVVREYLEAAGLLPYLAALGFHIVGYGCATCIGNSGPLLPEITQAISDNDLLVTSVLSGNRNFEGRIHSLVKANYLASPPLVVAYALAGTTNIDLTSDPIGLDKEGKKVYLKDIWPSSEEILRAVMDYVQPEMFKKEYSLVYENNELWNEIKINEGSLYEFDKESTYIRKPPFFEQLSMEPEDLKPLKGLRVIASLGDSVTTDHISPAGAIGKNTPAGRYLMDHGIEPKDFNTYGSRRGNHEVMMRGTFANIRIRNRLAGGIEGGYTTYLPTGELMSIYEACMKYKEDDTGLVVLAGKDYGMGSSRDWAAKGPSLLGVKAVIAESFERIHRSNLVMMGVLPLQFMEGESADSLGFSGKETIDIIIGDNIKPGDLAEVVARSDEGSTIRFKAKIRFESLVDMEYYRHGGILQMVLRQKMAQ